MKRLTMSLDDELANNFESLVRDRAYSNRSEAFRDLVRQSLSVMRLAENPTGPGIATLSYVFRPCQSGLLTQLTEMQQRHSELTVSITRVFIDDERCVETMVLRGACDALRLFGLGLIAQTGVTHGRLQVVPLSAMTDAVHELDIAA